ncbi:chitin synthase export chaperone [Hymenopellis radicata]|nr:chitin synthase export chaperone [Hymenopellis radicata]
MGLKFGSFDSICESAALVVCPLVGTDQGIVPTCYSRNVLVGGTLIFQPSTCFIHIVAIIMTGIMIYYIRSKYTAVGRKEILMFFWLYALIQFLGMFLDSGIIKTSTAAYQWITAIYAGLIAATYCSLLFNAFVGFQWAEDGTPQSLWALRISCLVVFGVGFFLAIATFKGFAGMSYSKATGLWIVYLLWPLVCVAVYVFSQLILVFRTLDTRWPIGDILFGTAFWVIGMVILFAFSATICDAIKHYIDGLFFGELCVLLSVMMVYKYWDSITKEDLEFSVGNKATVWEVKDPLLQSGGQDFSEEESSAGGHSGGGRGTAASLVGGYNGQQYYGQRRGGYPPPGGY